MFLLELYEVLDGERPWATVHQSALCILSSCSFEYPVKATGPIQATAIDTCYVQAYKKGGGENCEYFCMIEKYLLPTPLMKKY